MLYIIFDAPCCRFILSRYVFDTNVREAELLRDMPKSSVLALFDLYIAAGSRARRKLTVQVWGQSKVEAVKFPVAEGGLQVLVHDGPTTDGHVLTDMPTQSHMSKPATHIGQQGSKEHTDVQSASRSSDLMSREARIGEHMQLLKEHVVVTDVKSFKEQYSSIQILEGGVH